MSAHPLNVLVLDQAKGLWGAQRYLLRLAPLLRDRGVTMTLAGPPSLELHQAWRDSGFDALELDIPVDRDIRETGRPAVTGITREAMTGLAVARRIADLTRSGAYDAIWANAHWTHVEASVAGRRSRTPVVLHLHEEALPGLGTWLRAGAVALATTSVAVSQAVAEGVPRIVAGRVRVIPNGVDTESMRPIDLEHRCRLRAALGLDDDDVMILAATRLDPTKRIEDLISCIRRLGEHRFSLFIAGSTSGFPAYEQEVRNSVATLPLGSVTFCGNREDMPALFGASDIVIHTGTVEGMPLTVIEAQSCGRPVVAYDVAGVAESMIDGTTGFLVPPRDVDGLASAVRRLAEDATTRTEMGIAARRHALIHHRLDDQADRNAGLLRKLCNTGRKR